MVDVSYIGETGCLPSNAERKSRVKMKMDFRTVVELLDNTDVIKQGTSSLKDSCEIKCYKNNEASMK